MANHILAFILGIICFQPLSQAQPEFTITGQTANPGDIVEVDFVVNDFDSIISAQFSVNWDETILAFDSLKNITTLAGLSEANFGTNAANVDNGDMPMSWLEPSFSPADLPDGTVMFTIQFEVIGSPCDSSAIVISDTPLAIEVAQGLSETPVGLIVNNGYVSIPGTNCGGADGLTVTGGMVSGEPGQNVCVEFVAQGFDDIGSLQFTLTYNPAVIDYDRIQNLNIPGSSSGNFGTTNVSNGEITFVWIDSNAEGVTLPDGTVLFEICFDVVGATGQMTTIDFTDTPLAIEVSNGDGEILDFEGNPGKVTVTGEVDGFALILPDTIAGDQNEVVCVPVTVNAFEDISSMQFSINWDPDVIQFESVEGFNLPDLDENSFGTPMAPGVEAGQLSVLWFDFSVGGVTVEDGTEIFTVCFRMIGSCESTTAVEFTSDPLELEVADVNGIVTVTEIESIAFVDCAGGECGFTIDAVTDPLCAGDSTGSILIDVFGCQQPITYVWSNGATTQDLTNVPAGTYSVTITTGDNQFLIPDDFVLEDPDPITVSGTITNVMAGNDGAVDITVSGGTPPFTFLWDDDQMSTTEDISGLDVGSYSVTITDLNKCVFIAGPYPVLPESGVALSVEVTPVACFGAQTGAIDLTVESGVAPFTFLWSNDATSEDISGLSAGVYTVTVTDNDGNTAEISATVTQPNDALTVDIDTTNETQAGSDGAIDLTVSGGEMPYTFLWSTGDTTEDLFGLTAGEYSVTITDNFGCEIIETIIISGVALALTAEASEYSGFGVSCFGECDGQIIAFVPNAVGTATYAWNTGENTQSISGLCAGAYSVTVSDDLGRTAELAVTLTEPPQLEVDVDVTCASGPGVSDGVAMATVEGGVPPYRFEWNDVNASTTQTVQNQPAGQLILFVQDENNCESMTQVEICLDGVDCFEAISVITPNGDDRNDRFIIQCIFDHPNRLWIYNRWGGLEFEMENYDNSWEGTDQDGEDLSDGGYHWVLEVFFDNGDSRIYRGTITVVRSLN